MSMIATCDVFGYKRFGRETTTKSRSVVLSREPVKHTVMRCDAPTPDNLVNLLNQLERSGEIINNVSITEWTLGCDMEDDVFAVIAKGSTPINLAHYVWYGRDDEWVHALTLEDVVNELRVRYGRVIRDHVLAERCLRVELEVTVEIAM